MRRVAALLLLTLAAAHPADAHGIDAQLQGDGHVMVAFRYAGGAPMAGLPARVFAPANSRTPVWDGVADLDGRVAFTAGRDGVWRIDLTFPDGHVDRSFVTVENGLPVAGGWALPRWLLAISLTGNILTFLFVAAPNLQNWIRRRPRSPLSQRTTP